jgi:ABC-type branched-subunit amino acid transport system ATPase component
MEALRCPPPDSDVTTLSGGERRRVALCRLLLSAPDLLLLDEPTNHLDAESVAWLERFLDEYQGTVVAVTHDRYFLDNVAGWILELDRGEGIPWKGNYSSWLEQKQKRIEKEQKAQDARAKTLQHELEWIRMSPKGRHAKGKARITAYEQLLGQDAEKRIDELEIYIPPGPRLGDVVIEANGVRKAFGDTLLMDNLTFSLPAGGIVGVIGPNGAGKTTLFNLITGLMPLDHGDISFRGEPLNGLGTWERARRGIARTFQNLQVFANMSVWENVMVGRHRTGRAGLLDAAFVSPRARREERLIRERALQELTFVGLEARRDDPAASLPFGQQRLLEIARCLAAEPTLLLLDEPAAGLHGGESERLGELILEIRRRGITVLLVEHLMDLVMRISDEVTVLNYGEVLAEGPPAAIQSHPAVIEAYLGVDADA